MSKILVIAEHLDGKLNSAVAKTVSAAAAVGGDIDVLVLAADPAAIAAEAAQIAGVGKVLTLANPANEHALAQVLPLAHAEVLTRVDVMVLMRDSWVASSTGTFAVTCPSNTV